MRVGEVAGLSIADVRSADGTVKNEIRLDAAQTKGKHARTIFVNDRLHKEIASYLKLYADMPVLPRAVANGTSGAATTWPAHVGNNPPAQWAPANAGQQERTTLGTAGSAP